MATGCTIFSNRNGAGGQGGMSDLYGGTGGNGGNGGGIWNSGIAILTSCTFAGNSAGAGGLGGYGTVRNGSAGAAGKGAGILNTNYLELVNCTIATNLIGGGLSSAGTSSLLLNSLIALNSGTPADVSGTFTSLGHNLIGATNGASGFSGPGDLVGSNASPLNPNLGFLADNGGATPTMALLLGSPAIDAGSAVGAPATDQRGVYRPQGSQVDIGAFEYQYSPVIRCAAIQNGMNRQMKLAGLTSNLMVTLQVSTNLLNWWDATNFTADPNGVFQCVDPIPDDAQSRFYRLKSDTP